MNPKDAYYPSLSSILTSLPKSESTVMAEAMLEDDFKSSHPDLTIWMRAQDDDQEDNNNSANFRKRHSLDSGDSDQHQRQQPSPSKMTVRIQEPPKRRKLDPSMTVRNLVHEISVSATSDQRMEVLQRAKEFLDHAVVDDHDAEIAEGVDVALVKHLVLLILKVSRLRCHASSSSGDASNWPESASSIAGNDNSLSALVEEACLALEAMEFVYRASDRAVGDSFQKIGSDMMHVLVSLIDEELNRRVIYENKAQAIILENNSNAFKPIQQEQEEISVERAKEANSGDGKDEIDTKNVDDMKDDDSTPELQRPITPLYIKQGTPEGDFLLQKAIKVIGNLARVGKATKPMAYFPGLLGCMLNLINYQPYDCIPWEARLSALWILGNLACNPENMQMMMCTPGLVRSLVRVGCRALHADDPMEVTMEILRSRSLSSRALLNLSWKPENKIPLSENAALVELLTQLAVHRKSPALNNSRTVRDILLQTRCHAVGALRNLAAAPRRTKIQLCEYKNGHVLDALTDVALNDSDKSVQNRAFAAIHNLAVHDTAQKMVERPALVLALKDVLLEEQDGTNDGNDNTPICKEGSPRSHASATLLVLERTITPEMDSYDNLRDLLDAVNPTVASDDEDVSGNTGNHNGIAIEAV